MPDPSGPTTERFEGPTPNGGVASEIFYQDESGQPVPKELATRCEIVELDADGNQVARTYGTLSPPESPP